MVDVSTGVSFGKGNVTGTQAKLDWAPSQLRKGGLMG